MAIKSNFESKEPCTVCGTFGEGLVCYHHLLTRKAHSEFTDCSWNKLPLCFFCHHKAHSMALSDFSIKHRNVESWLIAQRWTWNEYFKKWDRPEV